MAPSGLRHSPVVLEKLATLEALMPWESHQTFNRGSRLCQPDKFASCLHKTTITGEHSLQIRLSNCKTLLYQAPVNTDNGNFVFVVWSAGDRTQGLRHSRQELAR